MSSSSGDDGWDIDWMTAVRWTAEIGSYLPVAGEVRDVGELMLGRDIWGNELTGMDRVLTGVGLALPMVPASALRRMGRFVGERITDPMDCIRPSREWPSNSRIP